MPWKPEYNDLHQALIQLVNNQTSARRYVAMAGMPDGNINFQGAISDIWFSIIEQADNQNKIVSLVQIVWKDYPDHQQLLQAIGQLNIEVELNGNANPPAIQRQAGSSIDTDEIRKSIENGRTERALKSFAEMIKDTQWEYMEEDITTYRGQLRRAERQFNGNEIDTREYNRSVALVTNGLLNLLEEIDEDQ